MSKPVIIELEPPDYNEQTCSIERSGEIVKSDDKRRETLLYSIYDLDYFDNPWLRLYREYPNQLKSFVWAVVESCIDCEYWLATFIWNDEQLNEIASHYSISIEPGTWGQAVSRRQDTNGEYYYKRTAGYALIKVSEGSDPFIDWVLLGHDPANHFYAVPGTTSTIKHIFDNPASYPGAIQALSDSRLLLSDSCFEITGFGPNGDHLRIAYSPLFMRSRVRKILRSSYNLPYGVIKLSREEYALWLNGHHGFLPDIKKMELIYDK